MKTLSHYRLKDAMRTDHVHPSQRLVFAKLSLWRRFMRMFGK